MTKVLGIDDNEENLIFLSRLLKELLPGTEFLAAKSGEEGIKLALETLPEIIILDLFMPGMNGFEVCQKLKGNELVYNIPIIMLSAKDVDSVSRIKALEFGADAFISKPIEESELVAQIKVLIRIKQAEDKLRKEKYLLEERVLEKTKALHIKLNESKLVEEALRHSEQKLKEAEKIANIGYWEYDLVTDVTTWSDNLFKLYGYKKNEIEPSYNAFLNGIHPDDLHLVSKYENIIKLKQKPVEFELRYCHSDKTIFLLNRVIPEFKSGELVKLFGINQDITDRKKAIRELEQQSHELWLRIQELNCLFGISKVIEKPGISINEILQGIIDLIPPAWQYPDITCACIVINEKVYKTANYRETPWKLSSPIELKKDKIGLLEVSYLEEKPIRNEGPFLTEERNLINAIAERLGKIISRKQAEETMRESEERFRSVMETASDAIVFIDRNGDIIFWNRAAQKIFGYTKEEIVDKSISIILPEIFSDVPKIALEQLEAIGCENLLGETIETTGIQKYGREIPSELSFSEWKGTGSGFFTVIVRDISERKKNEEIINRSEEKYRTLFEDSKDVIFFSSNEGEVLDVNPAGVELFGYSSKEELLDVNIGRDLYMDPEDRERFKTFIKNQGFVKDFELKMKKKNDSQISVTLTASLEKDEKGNEIGYRGIIRDITKRVKNEKLLQKMNEELLETNMKLQQAQTSLFQQEKLASIGQLAAGVAHEINNPLGFVSSNFTTLEKYFNTILEYLRLFEDLVLKLHNGNGQSSREAFEKIKVYKERMRIDSILEDASDIFLETNEGYNRIKNIVENLRSFSRIDYESKIEKYDINRAIKNTLAVAQNEIKYAANIETDLPSVSLIECRGDEINQVLLNIIVNAAQAIESQNRKEMGKIKIKTFDQDSSVHCEISDNGPGIPKEIIDKIFDPFFTTKEVGKGTGLGLNICHDIVINKHGGDLKVKSEVGKGSVFSIELPIQSKFKTQESEV